jgi:hypothetical protein
MMNRFQELLSNSTCVATPRTSDTSDDEGGGADDEEGKTGVDDAEAVTATAAPPTVGLGLTHPRHATGAIATPSIAFAHTPFLS